MIAIPTSFPNLIVTVILSIINNHAMHQIAITFPLGPHQIMKPQVVLGIITTKWVLAIVLFTHHLFNPDGFTTVARFGTWLMEDGNMFETSITYMMPIFSSSFTAILNIYLTIKAY